MRKTLLDLPTEIDKTYEKAIQRIHQQDHASICLAMRVLAWLSHALAPLTVDGLQHALAVEPGDKAFDEEAITDISLLMSVCAGLVTAENDSQIVRLVHYTTQEYFERNRLQNFPTAQIEIAGTCLTYLSITRAVEKTTEEGNSIGLTRSAFWNYADSCWNDHARGDGEKVLEAEIVTHCSQCQVSTSRLLYFVII